MATSGEGSRGTQRTLRDLLTVTAAATAAALGVAVIVSPAVSYLDNSLHGSLSGLASDVPASVSAPVKRLLSPRDITVRVRPARPAPSIAIADSGVSPAELVTGRPDMGRPGGSLASASRAAGASAGAGAGLAGRMALALPAPEPAPASVPAEAEVEAPAPPAPVEPSLVAVPDDVEDPVSATKQRKRPSKPLRDAESTTVFSTFGTRTGSDPKASQRDDSDEATMTLASFSGDGDSGKAKGGKHDDKDHPDKGHGQDHKAKKRNPKPEMK